MRGNANPTVEDFIADASFRLWATGESRADEEYWENWIAEHPEKQPVVELAILLLDGPPFQFAEKPLAPAMVQAEWKKLKARTVDRQKGGQVVPPSASRRRSRRILLPVLQVAASILLVLSLTFAVRNWITNPLVEYNTSYGEQRSFVLPDSTLVELNANSTLAYRKQEPRKVWLDGEAYFRVKKKPETGARFLVLTDDLTVEVLGTAFNVVEKSDKTEVVLEEGSVKLNLRRESRESENELFMEPGDMVAYSAESREAVSRQKVTPETRTSWKDGELLFEDVALPEVMQRLEAIYGWKAQYATEDLLSKKISTPLPADDLESALRLLSKAIGIDIERDPEKNELLLKESVESLKTGPED